MRMKLFCGLIFTMALLLGLSLTTLATSTPVVEAITPDNGQNGQVVNVTIEGAKFHQKSVQVKLMKEGEEDIVATDLVFVSKQELNATFDLTGKTLGTWDLVVSNTGTLTKRIKVGILPEAFIIGSTTSAIVEPVPVRINIVSVQPNSAEADSQVTLTVKGSGFEPNMTVRLKQNNAVIMANSSNFISDSEVKANFNLTAANTGVYDVEVTNSKGNSASLSGAFSVVQGTVQAPVVDPNSKLSSIFFDFDKFNIRADQEKTLADNFKEISSQLGSGYLILGGHADERGSRNYNITLSAKRAETIKKYLVSKGIDPNKIIIYAYGKDFPAKTGNTEESWAYNRRVDVAIWPSLPSKEEALKK